MIRQFHLGDVLTVTTGKLLSPEHMDGAYKILNFLTGDVLYTHQVSRALKVCQSFVDEQFPTLRSIDVSEIEHYSEPIKWLDEQVKIYGEYFTVQPLPNGVWVEIDPIQEAKDMRQ